MSNKLPSGFSESIATANFYSKKQSWPVFYLFDYITLPKTIQEHVTLNLKKTTTQLTRLDQTQKRIQKPTQLCKHDEIYS